MSVIEDIALTFLRKVNPEIAHALAIKSLSVGIIGAYDTVTSSRLRTNIAGIELPNPIGLAAGFDKNAEALCGLARCGFGFLEVGAATPEAQFGNPKPRIFRLPEDQAVINRLGFNNKGMRFIAHKLSIRSEKIITGLNLGANKDSGDKVADFVKVLSHCGSHIDFATVNVSSPNTNRLRDFQEGNALSELLSYISETRENLDRPIPIFLKIAPDLARNDLETIAEVAVSHKIDAIIATNTTLDRDGINDAYGKVAGGLSGKPLFKKSTQVLANMFDTLGGRIPLIGVGGVSCGSDAYQKICAGASAIQLYTALIYQGFSLIGKIAVELDKCLERGGFENISEAVGSKAKDWL